MRSTITIAALLSLFWLLNSGHYNGLMLGMGAFSVLLVTWIAHRMEVLDHESMSLRFLIKLPRYWCWLVGQIFASNLDVARRVWRRTPAIAPQVVRLPLPHQSDVCRVIYANSINLTPGTLTIDMGDGSLLVHALSPELGAELEEGKMCARVSELER